MSTSLKPVVVYGCGPKPPNPWKVLMLLEELGVPYEQRTLAFPELKQPPFLQINPNGRVPAIEDPNTGITLWESGAILEYLIETYDKDHRVSFPAGTPESFHAKQWLHYQMSGQGPYYGQAVWFLRHHHEQLPSAQERYIKEIKRVTGVLDGWLEGRQYLVGDKFTFADLAFLPWQNLVAEYFPTLFPRGEFRNVDAWVDRMKARPAIAKVLETRASMPSS
ncbi:hypothetical protein VTK73DRAFT_5251 [Phialemonium thermophilum]|uniref:Glutathione S-transferase n=1 Tax=Phialemonium thermophilum TaxID=223376 RepID=A0ABR3V3V1_9PEZI